MKIIFKITYPNGMIYIGKDSKNHINYFGSPVIKRLEEDFPWKKRKIFCIKKEILWSRKNISEKELLEKEKEFIIKLGANNPSIGYNLRPKYIKKNIE
jgi:hypothetical protein